MGRIEIDTEPLDSFTRDATGDRRWNQHKGETDGVNFLGSATSESGTRSLMDDLGAIATAGGGIMNLGGGNPSLIPAAEDVFRARMLAFMQHDGAFERAIGSYDGPEGDRGFARALAELLRREYGWDVGERNVALTNGSQSAFLACSTCSRDRGRTDACVASCCRSRRSTSATPTSGSHRISSSRAARPSPTSATACSSTGWTFDGLDEVGDIGAICVSRPTNPTGNVVTDEEIERLGDFARTRDVPLIVDNAYGLPFPGIVYGDATLAWTSTRFCAWSLSKLGLRACAPGS